MKDYTRTTAKRPLPFGKVNNLLHKHSDDYVKTDFIKHYADYSNKKLDNKIWGSYRDYDFATSKNLINTIASRLQSTYGFDMANKLKAEIHKLARG